LEAYPYDPAKAKSLLAEAGYPDGFTTKLKGWNGAPFDHKPLIEALGYQLSQVGIKCELEMQEYGAFISDLRGLRAGPMYVLQPGWPADAYFWYNAYMPGSIWPYWSFPDEWKDIITKAASILDKNERLKLYMKAAEILREEAPHIFLFNLSSIWGANDRVRNWEPYPDDRMDFRRTMVD
jgi:peptide/nickel transport system substrate-binding protein